MRLWPAGPVLAAALAWLGLAAPAGAATYPAGFEERTIVSGLTAPTASAYAPDGRLFVIEKDGRLKVVPPGATAATTIFDISSRVNDFGDRGLLGLAVDSSFESNNYLYLLYTFDIAPLNADSDAAMVSQLLRVKVSPGNVVSEETVLLGKRTTGVCPAPANDVDCIPSDGTSHSIGTVRSAPDGTLWVGSGDAAGFSTVDQLAYRAYNEQTMAGKLLHVDRDGRGLPGHPFCPSNANLDQVCTKLHAKGFRNPFRFTLRPSGGVSLGDVGWGTREEIDLIEAGGKSYGWPCYEGSIRTPGYSNSSQCAAEYAKEGTPSAHTPPSFDYGRSNPGNAVIGGPTYTGDTYPAGYRGSIFYGDYVAGFVRRLTLDSQGRVSGSASFATGWSGTQLDLAPDGDLTYAAFGDGSAGTGSIRRIVYTPGNLTPTAKASASPTAGPTPLAVSFSSSGSSDPDGDPLTYDWDFGDGSAHSSQAAPSHTYTQAGVYTVRLTVSDGRGRSATDTVTVTAGVDAPRPQIDTPADESTYRSGDTVELRGSASDPQDGQLAGSALDWHVTLIHGSHVHPVADFEDTATASFPARRDHDADSHYVITLTATDSDGLSASRTIEIRPETVPFTVASSPSGAPVSYGSREGSAPLSTSAAIGFQTTVSAASSFTKDGRSYEFAGWSDGGARSHDVTVPDTATTLTAEYRENKAYNRLATASSVDEPGHEAAKAVDGDPATRWSSNYTDGQWLQVDLGSVRNVDRVDLDWEGAYASRYRILTSQNGTDFSEAANETIFGPGLHTSAFADRNARYIRVEGLERATLWGISLWEVKVFGAGDAPATLVDKAAGKPTLASSVEGPGLGSANAVDNNSATRWSSQYLDNQWWQVDLGSSQTVEAVELNWETAYAARYRILTSNDGTNFSEAASVSINQPGVHRTNFAPRSVRFVRVQGIERATEWGISLWDARVLGPPEPTDAEPPETVITAGPSGTSSSASTTFDFTATESGASFECRLDGASFQPCSSPKELTGLADGSHTFEVRAKDAGGNVDPTPASRTWTVSAAATPDLARGRPASASSTEAPGREPEKAVDGDPATRWSSNYTDSQWWQVDLGAVRQIDRVEVDWEVAFASRYRILTSTDGANFDEAADITANSAGLRMTAFAERSARYVRIQGITRATEWGISFWTVRVFGPPQTADATAPETEITRGPSGSASSSSATFEFSSSEPGSTFECRLDGGSFAACNSPHSVAGLARGSHTFEVRATDPAGNTDATPASRTWTFAPLPYSEAVSSTPGLVHWWRLNDGGTAAGDGKGTNNGTYLGGPTLVAGLLGSTTDQAHNFDGVNDYVDLAPGPFGAPSRFSVEAWVRLDTRKPSPHHHFLVTNSLEDIASDGFALTVNSRNRPQLFAARNSSSNATASASTALALGSVYHLVGTYDGTRLRIYVNGVERGSAAFSGPVTYASGRDLLLARQRKSPNRASRYLDGRLDEVALYSEPLGPTAVRDHYESGR